LVWHIDSQSIVQKHHVKSFYRNGNNYIGESMNFLGHLQVLIWWPSYYCYFLAHQHKDAGVKIVAKQIGNGVLWKETAFNCRYYYCYKNTLFYYY